MTPEQLRLQNQLEALRGAILASDRDLANIAALLEQLKGIDTQQLRERIEKRRASLGKLSLKQE